MARSKRDRASWRFFSVSARLAFSLAIASSLPASVNSAGGGAGVVASSGGGGGESASCAIAQSATQQKKMPAHAHRRSTIHIDRFLATTSFENLGDGSI